MAARQCDAPLVRGEQGRRGSQGYHDHNEEGGGPLPHSEPGNLAADSGEPGAGRGKRAALVQWARAVIEFS
jgi:hypothetical protein